jgi:capsular polysaccharide transport system permease protein
MAEASVFKQIQTQSNIILALAIREMEAEWGRYRLGYAWALFEPAMYIALMSVVHIYMRSLGSGLHGMTPVMFIICGVMPWFMFNRTATALYHVRYSGQQLLILPRVTLLDVLAARALSEFCTYNFVFLVFAVPVSIFDQSWPPRNVFDIIVIYNSAWLMGAGLGLALLPLFNAYPALENLIGSIMRLGFWTSGLFFVVVQFPSWTWHYLAWNPILNVTELLRSAWFPVYQTPVGSPYYIGSCIIILVALGLISERLMRRRLASE